MEDPASENQAGEGRGLCLSLGKRINNLECILYYRIMWTDAGLIEAVVVGS